MSKVYISDETTGVTVAQDGGLIRIGVPQSSPTYPTPAEFRKVIEGGLRWMLETHGEAYLLTLVQEVIERRGEGR